MRILFLQNSSIYPKFTHSRRINYKLPEIFRKLKEIFRMFPKTSYDQREAFGCSRKGFTTLLGAFGCSRKHFTALFEGFGCFDFRDASSRALRQLKT